MSGKGSLCKQNSSCSKKAANQDATQRKGCTMRTCDFVSPVRYLKHVGEKVAAAVVRITTRAAAPPLKPPRRDSHPPPRERARTSVAPIDSQRAEAIHDCIDFINSSSSMPRSNSVAR